MTRTIRRRLVAIAVVTGFAAQVLPSTTPQVDIARKSVTPCCTYS
jgi:hypothetical protein